MELTTDNQGSAASNLPVEARKAIFAVKQAFQTKENIEDKVVYDTSY